MTIDIYSGGKYPANALSNFINITSYRNGKFVKGICYGTNNVELTYGDSKEKTGTEVIFQPNPKYFTDKKIPIDFKSPQHWGTNPH